MNNLEIFFAMTKERMAKYIGIKIRSASGYEVIIFPASMADEKLEYYRKAYTKDLKLRTNNEIEIVGFTYGKNYAEIELNFEM